MRKALKITELLDSGWRFIIGDDACFSDPDYDDSAFRPIDLPHDWDTETEPDRNAASGAGGGYEAGGIGWYRLHFTPPEGFRKLRDYLYFEGIYMDASVWLNGEKIGRHGYGYTSFRLDCGSALREGENVIAVRVDNSHLPNSRWYSGSGIYRDVWFIGTEEVALDLWGVRCCTNGIYPDDNCADLEIHARVRNDSAMPVHADIRYRLLDGDGREAATAGTALFLAPGTSEDSMVRPMVREPHLWTVDDPYLYTLEYTVRTESGESDHGICRVGIRTAVFDADRGFLLNGKQVKIKGMCVHHDCGLAGAAGYREIWERRLRKLKDMGCNGIRCAHNPPDPVLLDLCDEMGFLVMDEIFDEWCLSKNKIDNYYSQNLSYGSGMFFPEDARKELVSMLRRDFNHPSVVLWSIGNEIPEQSSAGGVKILRELQNLCHAEDPSRMVTSACDDIAAPAPIRARDEFVNALDVTGYNYVGRWGKRAETYYEEDRERYPGRRFIGTENPSAGGLRGDYSTPENSLHDYRTVTLSYESLWRYERIHDFVAGDYLWTGIDYLGEAEWPHRGALSGVLDTAGFEKDTYYFFRSIWNEKEVTLHLLPHWNMTGREGEFIQVLCYTNCDAVKLFLNGRYVGMRACRSQRFGCTKVWNERPLYIPTTNDLHLSWDVPYEPGELRAEGYIGTELAAVEVIRTTGRAASLRASSDVTHLGTLRSTDASIGGKAERPDVAQIELSVLDADGNEIPDAAPLIRCEVQGPAHLLGMDAGDPDDHTVYASGIRRMKAGRLLATVLADAPGKARVRFHAENETIGDAETELLIE